MELDVTRTTQIYVDMGFFGLGFFRIASCSNGFRISSPHQGPEEILLELWCPAFPYQLEHILDSTQAPPEVGPGRVLAGGSPRWLPKTKMPWHLEERGFFHQAKLQRDLVHVPPSPTW